MSESNKAYTESKPIIALLHDWLKATSVLMVSRTSIFRKSKIFKSLSTEESKRVSSREFIWMFTKEPVFKLSLPSEKIFSLKVDQLEFVLKTQKFPFKFPQ